MSSYGVQPEGFVDKPVEVTLTEMGDDQRANIDPGFDTSTQSPAGQMNGGFSRKVREVWEVLQAAYNSVDPDKATDQALVRLSAITGTVIRGANKSTVTGRLNVDNGKTVPAGSIASVAGNSDARFVTLADVENTGGSPADFSVSMEAETAGIVVANIGTLTVIETAVTGWNSITNDAAALEGTEIEDQEDLRVRREVELRSTGSAAIDAIRADLLETDGVTAADVTENDSDVTDADGLTPHSIRAIVLGGTDNDIAQTLWDSKSGGIPTIGATSGTAVDSKGVNRTKNFDRPITKTVYMDLFITVNADPLLGDVYPTDGDDLVKAAVVDYSAANFGIGDDVILSQYIAGIFGVAGVLDVTLIEADFSASPAATANLPIASDEVSSVLAVNISVTTA